MEPDRSAKLPVPSLETAQARVDRAEDAVIDAGRKFDAAETKRERLTAEFITCSSSDRRDALWSKIQGAGVTYRRAKERRELAEGELVAAKEELAAAEEQEHRTARSDVKHAGGRPEKYDWLSIERQLGAKLAAEGLPGPRGDQAKLESWVMGFFSTDEPPSASLVRAHVKKVVEAQKAALGKADN